MQTQLRTPWQAMLWELWRVSRYEMLLRFGGLIAFMFAISMLTPSFDEPQSQVLRGILLFLIMLSCLFSSTWTGALENQHVGFSFRLGFTRPVSTRQLVLIPVAYSVVTAGLGYVITALFVRVALGQALPLVGPAVTIGCSVCVFICVAWSSTAPLFKIVGLFVAAIAISSALAVRHHLRADAEPVLLAIGKPNYFDLKWYEFLLLLVVAGLATRVTVASVARQRCGDIRRWKSNVSLDAAHRKIVRRVHRQSALKTFPSSIVAQCWFEVRRTRHMAVFACACTAIVLTFVSLVPLGNATWGGAHSPRIWLGALAFSPFLYQLLGTDGVVGLRVKQGVSQLSAFEAMRPLRCDQMIAVKLLVVAAWSLFGMLLMGLAAAVQTTIVGGWHHWSEMNQSLIAIAKSIVAGDLTMADGPSQDGSSTLKSLSVVWWPVGVSFIALLHISSTSMMLAFLLWSAKYPKLLAGLIVFFIGHMCLGAWDAAHGLQWKGLWIAYGYLVPLAAIALSVWAVVAAIWGGYFRSYYLAIVFVLWGIYVATTLALLIEVLSVEVIVSAHPFAWLVVIAGGMMPVAATASAPLALAAHRHA